MTEVAGPCVIDASVGVKLILAEEGRDEAIYDKVLEIAERVMARRKVVMTENMKMVFKNIYHQAQQYEIYPEMSVSTNGS